MYGPVITLHNTSPCLAIALSQFYCMHVQDVAMSPGLSIWTPAPNSSLGSAGACGALRVEANNGSVVALQLCAQQAAFVCKAGQPNASLAAATNNVATSAPRQPAPPTATFSRGTFQYMYIDNPVSYADAKVDCSARGARLASWAGTYVPSNEHARG
jgi:hypothetical protein